MSRDLSLVKACLENDGVIAYPTEAVWGLGCLPESEAAVRRILAIKSRSESQGLILVASNISQFRSLIKVSEKQVQSLAENWPESTSYLFPATEEVPRWIRGASDKVAIRMSQHESIVGLCELINSTLVSTSANPSGEVPASSEKEVMAYFPDVIDMCVSGNVGAAMSVSRIQDFVSGEVIRGEAK